MPPKTPKAHRCFVKDCPHKNEIGISYHQLPKNASQTLRLKWSELVPEVLKETASNPVRVCSKHFQASDFERDLRNEMLGLPMRRVLRQGAFPRVTIEEASDVKQPSDNDVPDCKTSESESSRRPISEKLAREVELLAEIAELQMKLLEKLGKKAHLDTLAAHILNDPISNEVKIPQEQIIKSIKNEVYKKKSKIPLEDHKNSDDIYVVSDAENLDLKTEKHENFKNQLTEKSKLPPNVQGPLAILDWKGHLRLKSTLKNANDERVKLQKMEPTMKLIAKSKTDKVRKKMIDEGNKNLQKRREEIEQYKLKIGKRQKNYFKNCQNLNFLW